MERLSKSDIEAYTANNAYRISIQNPFISRCVDGRYAFVEDLPACALAGADPGDLAVLYATARIYGFAVDHDLALSTLTKVVGGPKNISLHTDSHAKDQTGAAGCGHMGLIRKNPIPYNLTPEDVEILNTQIATMLKNGATETTLEGDHGEGAVLFVSGAWSVQAQSVNGDTQVFVHHNTLVDNRHKAWAKELVARQAVTLGERLDEEYLYQAMSDVTENHLLQTASVLAKGLPIYAVKFADDGSFSIEEMGSVQ